MTIMIPQTVLYSERLLLTAISLADEGEVFKMRSTAEMIAFTDSKLDETIEETRNYICKMNDGVDKGKWFIWAVKDAQSKSLMGSVSLWNFNEAKDTAELGYGLMPEYQGKGYMQEAVKAVMDFGYQTLGLKCIEAYTEVNHVSSKKLLESLGFKQTHRIEEEGFYVPKVFQMAVFKHSNR